MADHVSLTVKGGNKLVVVVSAMGTHTDELLNMALSLSSAPQKRELDMLLTVGERVSMSLLSIRLHELGITSVSLTGSQCGILTDENHGNARITKILGDRIRQSLENHDLVIVAGFQGVNPQTKEITTLGRGGSDLTALAIAHALKANYCEIYKDVDGVCTADPETVPSAQVLKQISWTTLCELTWAGASILHPRAVHLAAKYKIPFTIRSSFNWLKEGTDVKGVSLMETPCIKAIAHKNSLALLQFELGNEVATTAKGLHWLWEHGEATQITQQTVMDSKSFLTQLIPVKLAAKYGEFMKAQRCELVRKEHDLCCITIVGEGFSQSPETLSKILQSIECKVYLIDTSNTSILIGVKDKDHEQVMRTLHQNFIENEA